MSEVLTLENTALVLDSTCDGPQGFFDRQGLYLVPLRVHFGDESFLDLVDISHEGFYAKLATVSQLPTTSQPTVGEFTAVYEKATRRYQHVFSLHLSAEMSGTVAAARQAAEAFPQVEVYDTRLVCSNIALCAERLRARLARGTTLEEMRAYIKYTQTHSHLLFHAATLEYLRRGGRIGLASSLIGGVLDIKPVLRNIDGKLAPYAKVRGQKKALAKMAEFVEHVTDPDDEIYYGLIDAFNEQEPPLIKQMMTELRPRAQLVFYGKVGAVVGTHIGPGAAGISLIKE